MGAFQPRAPSAPFRGLEQRYNSRVDVPQSESIFVEIKTNIPVGVIKLIEKGILLLFV